MTALGLMFSALLSCCTWLDDLSLRLQGSGMVCSGTPVAEDVILTANHCYNEAQPLSFVDDQPVVMVEIVRDTSDHALIRVAGVTFKKFAPVGAPIKQGDQIRFIGNPGMEPDVYREGYVSRVRPDVVLMDAIGFPGDSGAGVFNTNGQLVAVVSGGMHFSKDVVNGPTMTLGVAYPLTFTPEQLKKMNVTVR